jgi:hypothetical protein
LVDGNSISISMGQEEQTEDIRNVSVTVLSTLFTVKRAGTP